MKLISKLKNKTKEKLEIKKLKVQVKKLKEENKTLKYLYNNELNRVKKLNDCIRPLNAQIRILERENDDLRNGRYEEMEN